MSKRFAVTEHGAGPSLYIKDATQPDKGFNNETLLWIARIHTGTRPTPRDYEVANLLAAAPEMLEALEAILTKTEYYPAKRGRPYCGGSFLSEALFAQALSAIAKAKGSA